MVTTEQCQKALEHFEDDLIQRQNVVGLGIVTVEDSHPPQRAVAVYVSEKVPEAELPSGDVIPRKLTVPFSPKPFDVPTVVIEQGVPELELE